MRADERSAPELGGATSPPGEPRPQVAGWVATATRLTLGLIFVYLGAVKVWDPVAFLKLVRQFDAVHAPLALNAIAAVLPWFEVFCGALLIFGVKPRGAAVLQLLLLIGFTALVFARALAIYHAGGTPFCGIRFDCGCGTGEVLICVKLVENAALMALAGFVASSQAGAKS